MFSKEEMDSFIQICKSGDNGDKDDWHQSSLLLKLLESKFLIDRWGYVMTDIILNPVHEQTIKTSLVKNNYFHSADPLNPEDYNSIWGARFHFSENISEDHGLSIALTKDFSDNPKFLGRTMAVFPM